MFDLTLGAPKYTDGGLAMFDPDKWAEETEKRLKEHKDSQAQQKQESFQRAKLFNEEAPHFWPKVRDAFKQLCEAYNKRQDKDLLFFGDIGQFVFSVRRTDNPGGADVLVERTLARSPSRNYGPNIQEIL